ncbi:MAG: retroviral-like aspartic protease family protein, partial [Bacteroidetes bacterium]|nr:retroviral-like aspartic protease family protein [Bacteroidota bacterium]
LIRMKLINENDFLPGKTYSLADGSTVKSPRFIIKQMKIGGYVIRNIEVSITNSNADPLLGQNVLSKFKSVIQDNEKKRIVLRIK